MDSDVVESIKIQTVSQTHFQLPQTPLPSLPLPNYRFPKPPLPPLLDRRVGGEKREGGQRREKEEREGGIWRGDVTPDSEGHGIGKLGA